MANKTEIREELTDEARLKAKEKEQNEKAQNYCKRTITVLGNHDHESGKYEDVCADVIVHGHAHHGFPSGKTPGNISVYNVSRFVQMAHNKKPYCVIDL